ncbi:MAG: translational GTPase TypA [Cyanobacteria bacterium SZAS LIN-3]|nr:translational GTPase TypA [Cyanobacteria bacterium SZAS LIN-3]MBS2005396.1 translational GTPase TypA [Cyanobacteria bacterium SZAS TMP-1]
MTENTFSGIDAETEAAQRALEGADTELSHIRNIAIIAHVDHGKTTLVDGFLKQTGVFRDNQEVVDCVMDSNDLERERGITILAKTTAVKYKDFLVNIVDTPGHADFGGEVERILGMVDSCLLVVDCGEGPMPQTRFVLRKALERGLRPIVVINKVDRPNIDPHLAVDKVFDLFVELGATGEQLDFPYLFASGVKGIAMVDPTDEGKDLTPLLDLILSHCPAPTGSTEAPLQMQISILDYSDYLGRIGVGRVYNGKVKNGEQVSLIKEDGSIVKGKITKLFTFHGLKKVEVDTVHAGEIAAIAGFTGANVGDTIASLDNPIARDRIKVDEPTMKMAFLVNDSPFAGQEGKFVTSRQLRSRLFHELETNVSMRVDETQSTDTFIVSGRGELHLGILIETMRREGYEFQVSRPEVILKEIDGQSFEPFEKMYIDVPDDFTGAVMNELGPRKAELQNMTVEGNQALLEFIVPTRGLIGFRSEFLRLTKGNGVMNHAFLEYRPWCGEMARQRNGALVAWEEGLVTAYALAQAEDRGVYFISPGVKVYGGMIVGEHNRSQDLDINVCKMKKLTNMRASSADATVVLQAPREMNLEKCLEYIEDDELLEVTPQSVRMRKRNMGRR